MKIPIQPRHFSGTIGLAHHVNFDHPFLCDRLRPEVPVRLWVNGNEVTTPTSTLQEVQELGEGRAIIEGTKLWLSIPGNPNPREASLELVVELATDPLTLTPPEGSPDESTPLLIVGPQRSGTTALQWALDAVTPYKVPRDLSNITINTLEGFYLTQLLMPFLTHPFLSPFGSDGNSYFWKTGLFVNSGIAFEVLRDLARHIDAVYSTMSGTAGRWIDKCPGWDTVAMAPIFLTLFPKGRVMFMSREPVGNVFSILRLNGMLPHEVGEEKALDAIASSCALWVIGHFLWRTYAKPALPELVRMEIRFADFRSHDMKTLKTITDCLGLESEAAESIRKELACMRIQSHKIDRDLMPDWMPSLVWTLCRDEAREYGYEGEADVAIPKEIESRARREFVHILRHFRNVLGISPDALEWKEPSPGAPLVMVHSRLAKRAPFS